MIKVVFFAQTRELVGVDEISLELVDVTVEAIRQQLIQRGGQWERALNSGTLLTAINHTMCPLTAEVKSGDEVAFFPPVTGG